METPILVRLATPDDADAIAAVHVASWKATYRGHMDDAFLESLSVENRTGMWRHMLARRDDRCGIHVAGQQGDIVGFCSFGPARDDDLSVHANDDVRADS